MAVRAPVFTVSGWDTGRTLVAWPMAGARAGMDPSLLCLQARGGRGSPAWKLARAGEVAAGPGPGCSCRPPGRLLGRPGPARDELRDN